MLDDAQAILAARAEALAVSPSASAAEGSERLFVVPFMLARETYAVEAAYVREVQPLRDLTTLPGAPAFVLGLVNVRGQVLSVVDLRVVLGLQSAGLVDLHRILILRHLGMEFGIAVGSVFGLVDLAVAELDPVPPTLDGVGAACVRGVTHTGLILLDAVKVLTNPDLVVDQRATQSRGGRRGAV